MSWLAGKGRIFTISPKTQSPFSM